MKVMKFWIVDTFSDKAFQGVPAAVFFAEDLENDVLLQDIAMEINSPESIFIKERGNGDFESISFSPKAKGLFLGNSLFAAAKVINEQTGLKSFNIISGIRIFLTEIDDSGKIKVRFSTVELNKVPTPPELNAALNNELVVSIAECKDELIVEIRSPKRLLNLSPSLDILSGINYSSFVITADTHYESDLDYDFCAKVFAPKLGIYHDIATPISCAKLAAYWHDRIEKTDVIAFGGTGKESGKININYGQEFTHISGRCSISTTGELLF